MLDLSKSCTVKWAISFPLRRLRPGHTRSFVGSTAVRSALAVVDAVLRDKDWDEQEERDEDQVGVFWRCSSPEGTATHNGTGFYPKPQSRVPMLPRPWKFAGKHFLPGGPASGTRPIQTMSSKKRSVTSASQHSLHRITCDCGLAQPPFSCVHE